MIKPTFHLGSCTWLYRWSRCKIILPIWQITPFALPIPFVLEHFPLLLCHSFPSIILPLKNIYFSMGHLSSEKLCFGKSRLDCFPWERRSKTQHFCFHFSFLFCFLLLPVLHSLFCSQIKGWKERKENNKWVYIFHFSSLWISSLRFPLNNRNIPSWEIEHLSSLKLLCI